MNASLKRLFPVHPHFYKFMDCLRLHEFSKSLDMLDLVRKKCSKKQLMRRKKRDRERERKIQTLTLLLKENGQITPARFLLEMASDVTSLEKLVEECWLRFV